MEANLLLIIDPQNDFVDSKGSLYIPGAENGIDSICDFIKNDNPLNIIITQDTHQYYHIGHSDWWKEDIPPFTKITLEDVKTGKYNPKHYLKKDAIKYINTLPNKTHTIWPKHCIKGSWGWAFPDKLVETLNEWSIKNKGKQYEILEKGTNPNREMYSAITEAGSNSNILQHSSFINRIKHYDKIYIAGFARDVCVAWTVKDLINSGKFDDKLIFLKDCMTALDPKSEMEKVYENGVKNHKANWK